MANSREQELSLQLCIIAICKERSCQILVTGKQRQETRPKTRARSGSEPPLPPTAVDERACSYIDACHQAISPFRSEGLNGFATQIMLMDIAKRPLLTRERRHRWSCDYHMATCAAMGFFLHAIRQGLWTAAKQRLFSSWLLALPKCLPPREQWT
jgi:hypothetical protein